MSIDNFIENVSSLDLAIKTCIEARLILPALVLIYAGLDIVASIERPPGGKVGPSFTSWIDRYVLKDHQLPCTATELYAARCGILHTLTPESELVHTGKARRIVYAWGSADSADLQETACRMTRSDIVVLHVEDLRWAFLEGTKSWFQEIYTDKKRLSSVEMSLDLWFVNVSQEIIKKFLQSTDPKTT